MRALLAYVCGFFPLHCVSGNGFRWCWWREQRKHRSKKGQKKKTENVWQLFGFYGGETPWALGEVKIPVFHMCNVSFVLFMPLCPAFRPLRAYQSFSCKEWSGGKAKLFARKTSSGPTVFLPSLGVWKVKPGSRLYFPVTLLMLLPDTGWHGLAALIRVYGVFPSTLVKRFRRDKDFFLSLSLSRVFLTTLFTINRMSTQWHPNFHFPTVAGWQKQWQQQKKNEKNTLKPFPFSVCCVLLMRLLG